MIIEIQSQSNRLSIDSDLGGRATQFIVNDLQVLAPAGDNPLVGGWYLMAPWAGRLAKNSVSFNNKEYVQDINFQEWSIHGTSAFEPGDVQNITKDSVEIVHQTNKNWPVAATILQRWSVSDKYVKCFAQIASEQEFPAQIGWHPWFLRKLSRGDNAKFGIEATAQYVKDENFITQELTKEIGIPPFDDAFEVPTGKGFIEWPNALRIDFQFDHTTFVIFDEPQDSFCIEPQTGAPNSINRAQHLVGPNKPLSACVKWEITQI